ncbi:MAG: TIGR00730 family Rossman fold protein [Pseudomonadota bacterium]
MTKINSLCVYCGSRVGDDEIYAKTAKALGESLVASGTRLVYGGGKLGLMGVTASAVRDGGGKVFGVIPNFLVEMEGVLDGVDHILVETMHERKMRMFEESDAFCVLPGGIGTLEEIIELLSWVRLDLHRKPLVILNVDGFWDPLITLLHHVVDAGFAAKELKQDLVVVSTPEEVLPAASDRLLRSRV